MATKDLKTVLQTPGEVSSIHIGDNIYFEQADDPSADDMLMAIQGGHIRLTKQYSPNKRWTATDATDVTVTTTSTQLLSVTIDEAIDNGGSWLFSCKVENTANQSRTLAVHFQHNGTVIMTKTQEFARGTTGTAIFSGAIANAYAAGDTLDVFVQGDNSGLTILGTDKQSSFVVEKEVVVMLGNEINTAQNDTAKIPLITATVSGTTPTKAEIESALTSWGISLPFKSVQVFILVANGNKWLTIWDGEEYLLQQMTIAV